MHAQFTEAGKASGLSMRYLPDVNELTASIWTNHPDHSKASRLFQAIEAAARGGQYGHPILQVGEHGRVGDRRPTVRGQVWVFLERKTARGRGPGNQNISRQGVDAQ